MSDESLTVSNADCPWDEFDSNWYLKHNYEVLHDDDRAVIQQLGCFLARYAPTRDWHGIDVGSGTNLYPALAMLPLTDSVTLWEYSAANVRWLEHGIRPYSQSWDQFWDVLCASHPVYQRMRKPRSVLPTAAKIEKASIFDLPESEWDVGTMFFVAESITAIPTEFELATTKFVQSLKPGAPFFAAFIRNSRGYAVGAHRFPAVAITENDVRQVLRPQAAEVRIHRISSDRPFRDGYEGIICATGLRARAGSGPRRWRMIEPRQPAKANAAGRLH